MTTLHKIITLRDHLGNIHKRKIYLYLSLIAGIILILLIRPISGYTIGLYHMNIANRYISDIAPPTLSQNLEYYCQPHQLNSFETNTMTKAMGHIERSISLTQSKPLAYNYLMKGRIFCLQGQYKKAIKSYKEFLQLQPQSPLGYIELALAYEARCRNEYTLFPSSQIFTICSNPDLDSLTKQAWLKSGQKPDYFLEAGIEKQNKQDKVLATYWYRRTIWLYPNYKDGFYYLGKSLLDNNQAQQAILVFEQGIQAQYGSIGNSNFHFYLAKIYKDFIKPRDIDKIQYHAQSAIELNEFGDEEWQISGAYYFAGWSFFAQKEYMQSIAYLKTSTDLNPTSYWATITLAEAYLNVHDYENALSYAQRAREINPADTRPLLVIGEVYMLQGENDKAYLTYQKVLSIDSNNEIAINRLGELKP